MMRIRRPARLLAPLGALLLAAGPAKAQQVPTVDDLLSLSSVGGAQISPDGRWVAYVQTGTDWKQDQFVGQVWVADVASGTRRQLTRGERGASAPRWSPDGAWLAFNATRDGGRAQVHAIRPDGGEAVALTRHETAIGAYAWSPDGRTIAFTAADPESPARKERKEKYGDFEVVRSDYTHVHLWTVPVDPSAAEPPAARRRTGGSDVSVGGFDWSPDGTQLAFSATVNPDLINGHTADIYVVTLAAGGERDELRKVVDQPGPDNAPRWSPDGRQLAFTSVMGRVPSFARNVRIAVVPATGGTPRSLTDAFDENAGLVDWTTAGIWFTAAQRTATHAFRLDPTDGRITRVTAPDAAMIAGWSLTADGSTAAFTVHSPTALAEIAVSPVTSFAPRVLTASSDQIRGWLLGTREVVRWTSRDGTEIEGVLIKPAAFDPQVKRPLLCIIHGGPTGTDRPALPDARYYPVDIWAAQGALVLKVNYRGSASYGERFRLLNVRNLGVGDAWDVESGVDHLIARGWVDPARVGVMGWSQGGYISAFLTTNSTKFAAVSVGAGISNWATYYYNTDITPFTINYLGDDPGDDPAIYRKTSPMTNIRKARTPTLIQHGELDRRVPIANAYELRQGLADRGVPVEMVVYKGFGHGITRPKSMRAVMDGNVQWFGKWVFGRASTTQDAGGRP
jgi:dipeptidyl aminopeptidase/acylaminoacyl peptidase